jgi:TRAP-type C4-dicarboxylate transport system substrate-binding protein
LSAELVKAFGAESVVTPSSEVYLALQRGVFDGTITNAQGGMVPRKWYEVTRYVTEVPLAHLAFAIAINQDTWNKLSQEQKNLLTNAAAESQEQSVLIADKEAIAAKAEMARRAPALSAYRVPPDELGAWRTASQKVYEVFAARAGESGKAVLKQIEASK